MRYLHILMMTALLHLPGLLTAGGPWTQNRGEGMVIGNITPVVYKTMSSAGQGGIDLRRRVTDVSIQGYLEHGLTDRVLFMANMVLKYAGTSRKFYDSANFTSLLPSGRTFGMGNSSLGIKYRFTSYDKPLLFSASFQIEFPGSNEIVASGLRTGYDAWTFLPSVHLGRSFDNGIYFIVEGGFAAHTQISHEYRLAGEFGYDFKRPLIMALAVTVKQSLQNKPTNTASNFFHTGLYLNNQEFAAWSVKFIYEASEQFGMTTALAGGFTTQYIARTPVISAGLYYKWKKRTEEGVE